MTPRMTAQEMFDFVVRKLREQGKPSYNYDVGICQYRYGALRCAAGFLIDDDEYRTEFEDDAPTARTFAKALDPQHPLREHMSLACALQCAHDDVVGGIEEAESHDETEEAWGRIRYLLRNVATNFHLSPAVIEEAPWKYKEGQSVAA